MIKILKQIKKFKHKQINRKIFFIYKNNIIKFKQKKEMLTDNDYISLFMGIIKLIKEETVKQVLSELIKDYK